jgi:cytochrome d ubiquinol oxidase subunit II
MSIDLPLIWAGVIAFGIFMYVVMDGFDLGIGILYPFFRDKDERDAMMNTVAPIWDGNETWLVLGGAGLFAAFPLAYSVVLTALYLPLVIMLIALIFRGVAFEFRFKAKRTRHVWDAAFIWGSILATFAQGVVLGAFIEGIKVENRAFAGGPFDWLAPFPLFCGAGLVVGYAMLGCAWLLMKTEGKLRHKMYKLMLPLTCLQLLFIAAVSIWTPLAHESIAQRWFTLPNLFYFIPVPTLVAVTILGIVRAVHLKIDPGLHRPGHQPVAKHHPAVDKHLGGLGARQQPGLRPGRRGHHGADHPALHRLQLLGVPRQGGRRRGVPLDDREQNPAGPAPGLVRRPLAGRRAGCWHPRLRDQVGHGTDLTRQLVDGCGHPPYKSGPLRRVENREAFSTVDTYPNNRLSSSLSDIGRNALTRARPLLPSGTQIRENSSAARMRGSCPTTSHQSRSCQPARSISQCARACGSDRRWPRICARSSQVRATLGSPRPSAASASAKA